MTTVAYVNLWGTNIGTVAVSDNSPYAMFEYSQDFMGSGIEVAPLTMPLGAQVYAFANLPIESFHGLPGLLADSLPDKFGNVLIDQWLRTSGRAGRPLNPVERLCYTGTRGMGALEFEPAVDLATTAAERIELDGLAQFANSVLARRTQPLDAGAGEGVDAAADAPADADTFSQILKIGTSAGGARAKAIVAYNPNTGEVLSGQAAAPEGFTHWLAKFGGLSANSDKEGADGPQYTRIEYAYYLMARDAGIDISDSILIESGEDAHFLTRRFDRTQQGGKIHMLTLGGMAHFDFNQPAAHSYEQLSQICGQLHLGAQAGDEVFRRMCFNVAARNNDDHVKNTSFLMDRQGRWRLAPAYDLTYAYNPGGLWTGAHQMTINGKTKDISTPDLLAAAKTMGVKQSVAKGIIEAVWQSVAKWPAFAEQAKLTKAHAARISSQFEKI